MKKGHVFAALALLAAAVGCKVTEESSERVRRAEKTYPVHFVADEIETRTAFGEVQNAGDTPSYSTFWTENDDKIAVSLNLNKFQGADVQAAEDYKSATFDAEFPQSEVTAPYMFYAMSPFSAVVGASSSHGGYHFNILAEQTPLANSCDEGAQVLVSSQKTASIEDFKNVDLHFSHVTAYGKLTLKNMLLPEGATVQSIDLTASVPFAGRFYYKFADGSLEASASSRTVTLLPDNLTLADGTIETVWFACAPADLGGGTLRVDVNTSAGVLSRTVAVAEGKLSFRAGRVSKFTVNMTNAVFTQAVEDSILEQEAYGAYLSGDNRTQGVGDQLSREYMNDGTVTFAIVTPISLEVAEFAGIPVDPAKGDAFTLNYNVITGHNRSQADYEVTVVKVDGPKVWLSAGDGQGFIVKK